MSNPGFRGRKMCFADKHDLSVPDTIAVNTSTGNYYCRLCVLERKRASNREARGRCRTCGKVLPVVRRWAYCDTICEERRLRTKEQKVEIEDGVRTEQLLELHAALERETRAWMKQEIKAKIDVLMQGEVSSD